MKAIGRKNREKRECGYPGIDGSCWTETLKARDVASGSRATFSQVAPAFLVKFQGHQWKRAQCGPIQASHKPVLMIWAILQTGFQLGTSSVPQRMFGNVWKQFWLSWSQDCQEGKARQRVGCYWCAVGTGHDAGKPLTMKGPALHNQRLSSPQVKSMEA